MNFNSFILRNLVPWFFELILHFSPNSNWISSQLFKFFLSLILQLPKPVSLLNKFCLSHQKSQLQIITSSFIKPPIFLNLNCSHCGTSRSFVFFLWIVNDGQNLSLICNARNQIIFCIFILIKFCIFKKFFWRNVGELYNELADKLF
jgi:hypothetical protein